MNATNLYKQFLSSLRGRLLMGLLFALFTLTASAQANYDLHICGTQVTSMNCDDLSVIDGVSGIVNFNPETNTLTLDNATINLNVKPANYPQAISSSINLTILLKGNNIVKNTASGSSNPVILSTENLTITSTEGGELYMEKTDNLSSLIYVNNGNTLTIKDCSVIMNGSRANTWIWGVSAAGSTLTLDGASLKITDVCYPIKASAVNLQGGTYLAEPSNAVFDSSDKCYKVDGNEVQWNMKFKLMEPYVVYTPDNTTLTFYYDGLSSSREGTIYGLNENGDPAWRSDGTNASVTNVVFDPSFADARPTSTVSWFCDMYNLENISGLNYLNTSEVTNMMQMFAGQSKLTSLDLSGWNVENLGSTLAMFAFGSSLKTIDLRGWKTTSLFNTAQMFYYCSSLTTIYVSDEWTNANIGNSDNMFAECTSLKGYNGTTYDADHVDATYARLDGGTSAPGYFSELTAAPYVVYTPDNTTLTFYFDKLRNTRSGQTFDLYTGENRPDWVTEGVHSSVTRVVFDSSFADARPTSTYEWFLAMSNLTQIDGMEYLNTSEVTTLEYMFSYCINLQTIDVSHFDTRKVTNMFGVFNQCSSLQSLDLSSWNTQNVTEMRQLFYGCSSLTTLDLSSFDTQKVTEMNNMFRDCNSLATIYVGSHWSTGALISSVYMFLGCTALVGSNGTAYNESHTDAAYAIIDGLNGQPGYFWAAVEAYAVHEDDETIEKYTLTFYYDNQRASHTEGTVHSLNTGTKSPGWFERCRYVDYVVFDPSFANARPTTTYRWFCGMDYLQEIRGLEYLNTSEVISMNYMFYGCNHSAFTSLDLSNFNTANVKEMNAMFANCSNFTTIHVGDGWSTEKVTVSDDMFINCTALVGGNGTTYDADHVDAAYAHIDGGPSNPGYFTEAPAKPYAVLSTDGSTLTFYYDKQSSTREGTICSIPWTDITPDWYYRSFTTVTFDESFDAYHDLPTASYMFDRSKSLTTINNIQYLHTDHVTDMSYMFSECEMLTTLDVSYLNTSNVTTMRSMFSSCKELEDIIGLEYFNTSNVTDMRYMFSGDWALTTIDVSHFDVQEGCNLEGMFYNNINLTTIYSNSSWSDNWHASDEMFKYCYKLVGGKGTAYDSNNTNKAYARPDDPDNGNPGYFTVKPEAYAALPAGNGRLIFYYDNLRSKRTVATYDLIDESGNPGWSAYSSDVNIVAFDPSFADARPIRTSGWFYNMENLEFISDIRYLNTSKVTDMNSMFSGCSSLTELDLSNFDTSKVKYMNAMFVNCTNLTTIYVSGKWNTAEVAEHGSIDMFAGCNNLVGGNGTTYDVNHKDAEYARVDAEGTPGYFTAMPYLVLNGTTLTFYDDRDYNKEGTIYTLDAWNHRSEDECTNVTEVVFDPSFAHARPTTTSVWFYNMEHLTTITGMEYLNTSEVTEMFAMFAGCSSLTSLDLSSFNTSNVTDMVGMFYDCSALSTIYVGNGWSTEKVTQSYDMFTGCTSLEGGNGTTYSDEHVDAEYAHMDGGLSYPGYLTSNGEPEGYAVLSSDGKTLTFYHDNQRGAHPGEAYDLNTGENEPGWYTDEKCLNVTSVVFDPSFADARPVSTTGWFYNMENLTDITDMKYLNTSEVTNMMYMFGGCSNLTTLDVSNFNTANVTNMSGMFAGCSSLTSLDLSSFNTANVTGMDAMFVFNNNLKTIYVSDKWSADNVTLDSSNMLGMFGVCLSLVGGAGTLYDENHIDKEYARVDDPDNGKPGYFTYKASMLLGDVNGDGEVNVADITALTNYLLSGNAGSYNINAADVDGSGTVTKADISALVQLVLRQ